MEDDNLIGDLFKGSELTLNEVISQLEQILALFDKINKSVKSEDFNKWTKGLTQGSNEEKAALLGLSSLVEKLIKVTSDLSVVRSDSNKRLKEAEAVLKSHNKEIEREAEVSIKLAGSYARAKLELQSLLEQYKNTSDIAKKNALSTQISSLASDIMVANSKLKVLTQTVYNFTDSEKEAYQNALNLEAYAKQEIATMREKAKAYVANSDAYIEQIKAQKELKKARLEAIAGAKEEQIVVGNLSGYTYEQLEARYELLQMKLNSLTKAELESGDTKKQLKSQLDALARALESYDKTAGRTVSRMSTRQREWNGLTNSVYQITRELPNLAVRADTFFLAISNNIPIFIDEFRRAKDELGGFKKALMATLKSFGTGLALAIPLLILSKWSEVVKIFDRLFNTMEDGTLKIGAFYRAMGDSVKSVSQSFLKQIYSVRMLSNEWKKLSSIDDRNRFLYKYKEQIDDTGLAVTNLNDAEKAFSSDTDLIIEAYIARTKAAAAAELAMSKYKKAVEDSINAEGKASELFGREVSESDLREMFAKRYGITDERQIRTGKFKVDKKMLKRLIEDYDKAFKEAEKGTSLFHISGEIRARRARKELMELYDSIGGGTAEISVAVAEWIAAASEGSKGALDLALYLNRVVESLAQGDQATEKAAEYTDDWSDSMDKAGISLSDLTKKINDFSLRALKEYNDSLLELMNNPAYRRGGVSMEIPRYRVDEATGLVVREDVSENVKSSYDKSRAETRLKLQNDIKEIDNWLEELSKLKYKVSGEFADIIQMAISQFQLTQKNKIKAASDEITQIDLEEYAARAKNFAESLSLRLEALKEGSDEELELRKRLIRANMQAEIAENAKEEPALQKSVAAIRAKYHLELERAEREYFIKLAGWRKQDLENEQAYVNKYISIYAHNQADLERIAMQTELSENAELIESGQVSREAIIEKYNKRIEKIYDDHRARLLQGEKSFWKMMEEFMTEGSYESLDAQLRQYNLELEAEKLEYKELIEVMPEYGKMLDELYAKRIRLAKGKFEMNLFEIGQDIDATIFGSKDQIGEQQQAIFDLQQEWARYNMQIQQYEAGQLDLLDEEVDALYAGMRKVGAEMKKLTGWRGTLARIADHGLVGLMQLPDKDKNGKDILRDLSSEEYDAIETGLSSIKGSIDSVTESYIALAQAAYDAAQAQVDAARTAYEAELEARANGYANDVEGAKRELALARSTAKEKERMLKEQQRVQEHINTATQISNLITGSAEILKVFAATPYLAYALIAGMWGMFSWAKVKAYQAVNQSSYGNGGYELAVGGSHASGNDIKTGIRTRGGSQMVIEGGEGVGVFSKNAVTKYGDIIPALVGSINDGSYRLGDVSSIVDGLSYEGLNTSLSRDIPLLSPLSNNVDLSTIEGLLSIIISKQVSQPIVLSDGSIYEKKGNKVTITRKG